MASIQTTELPGVVLRSISVSEMDNNVYLLTSTSTGQQLLIDAADDPQAINELLDSARQDSPEPTKVVLIVTTHGHWDHVRALQELAAQTGATTAAGAADFDEIERLSGVRVQHELAHGDADGPEGLETEVIALRGHTPGSIALLWRNPSGPDQLFTGDSLFPGGVGKTANDDDFRSLIRDVRERVFDRLSDDTVVHPGHGDPTTLGAERGELDTWEKRGW